MKFSSRKNERNGVYIVVDNKKHGSHVEVTMKCTVCGCQFTRSNNTFLIYDLSKCICDIFLKGEKNKVARLKGKQVCDQWYSRCKTNFNSYLKEKLSQNPSIEFDDFDTIWHAVGPKPQDTEFCKYYLTRKNRGRQNPNFTADNMEWHAVTTSKAVVMAQSVAPGKSRRKCHYYAQKAKDSKGNDEFLTKVQLHDKIKNSEDDYRAFVGRKIKSFRIVDMMKTCIHQRTYYMFVLKCDRCGKLSTRPACKVLKDCRPCSCVAFCGKMAKNSSVALGSKLMWLKYKQFIRSTSRSLTIDELLILQAHMSEFTLYTGTPEYIESKLDAEFLGVSI